MNPIISFLLLFLVTFSAGCSNMTTPPIMTPTLRVGTMAGPHTEILYAVKEVAEKNGWTFEIIEFGEYDKPNQFLHTGKIDLNCFQNQFYLSRIMYERQYDFSAVAKSVLYPIGLYSAKYKTLKDLPDEATISLPDDPVNLGRSLALLAQNGLLTLKPSVLYQATLNDITETHHKLRFQLLDAARTAQALDTTDLVAINANYATRNHLIPAKNALALESIESPYATLMVVRSDDKEDLLVKRFITTYHSPEVKSFIERRFTGSILAAWQEK